ncbi:hypothetical protein ONR75_18410 [Rhodopseudomonas sp. P2A-2r]|uniref:hypothetical protein n=1 Tax=Rhodopseudomonas sp. P2A-2r TaxID=2991972 RepID=UPI002234A3FA|nr:hypothetical protein [Rhodopseudomonas sp. P2A-2r]UZE46981.1 hypothetical protein ONR75_18410 [Rhodopseudomonas sp. P2A-2r]
MRDLANNLHFKPAFLPGPAVTDNTAQVSTILDTFGAGAAVLAYVTGVLSDTDATFTELLEESNSSDLSGANTVAATDMIGTAALASFGFADDGECRKIGYIGSKRYVRATVTPAANTGNLFMAGMWILGRVASVPTPNPPQ